MQCTLLIPHLFWPRATADIVARGLELPALSLVLARAHEERYSPVTPEAWLCQAFEVERQHDWPVAPLTLAVDGGHPEGAYWLRADPVHIKVGREGLRVVHSALFDVSADEAQVLVAALNAHFEGSDLIFAAPHPKRWYVKVSRTPDLLTHTVGEVAGQDVQRHLPAGADALAWHGRFNEAQMVLHEHPVNEARETRGEPAVNSVWFWGGGVTPMVQGRHFASVASDDAVATALAAVADVPAAALPADASAWLATPERARDSSHSPHLVTLDQLATAVAYDDAHAWRTRIEALEAQWFAPLVEALRKGRLSALTVVALGAEASCRYTVNRADLLKLWRRPQPLSAYA
ncbi:MAG: 2,3-bisphosphoglycerate-independent phosphoglycerate mutase [Betaproteobacteria bacterium]|nr:2,3-bisphosphoglycerate-independent phosphoglycerate mutase [Betaproteobacteria bacterium]